MTGKRYFIIVFFLLAACVGTWLLLGVLDNQEIPLTDTKKPDSYMLNVTAIRMNELGTLKDQLQSPRLIHYPAGDTSDITSPHFIIYSETPNSQPWHITANYGKSHDGVNILDLWNNVILKQYAGPQGAAIIMTTSAMTIFPKQQYAQTGRPVKIWQMGSLVTSTGLHADLNTGEIDLLSQTNGKYQPATTTDTTKK